MWYVGLLSTELELGFEYLCVLVNGTVCSMRDRHVLGHKTLRGMTSLYFSSRPKIIQFVTSGYPITPAPVTGT